VVRGDKPIELGNSWFSAKTIEVVRHMAAPSALRAGGAYILTQ